MSCFEVGFVVAFVLGVIAAGCDVVAGWVQLWREEIAPRRESDEERLARLRREMAEFVSRRM